MPDGWNGNTGLMALQASFEAAKMPPVHPTDPSLTVAEVLPGACAHTSSPYMLSC